LGKPGKPILVIGSLNMDLVAVSERLPAKGETILGDKFMTFPGGKGGNQATAAAKLGAKVYMAGCVGNDSFGDELLASLQSNAVHTQYIERHGESTGIALITVDAAGMNTIVVVPGANNSCGRAQVDAALSGVGEPGILILQHELPKQTVEYAIRAAHLQGWVIVVNPAPARPVSREMLSMVDILIPNETEASAMTDRSIESEQDAILAAKEFVNAGVGWVVITLGSKGAVCCSQEESCRIEALKVNAVDTTAAGDAYIGALTFALSEGRPMLEGLHFASAAAAFSVTRRGAQPSLGTRKEIEEFVRGLPVQL
jgi:ribokinase